MCVLVDPAKLTSLRQVVDDAIVEQTLRDECSRRRSLSEIAEQLAFRLTYYKVGVWYVASLQPQPDQAEVALYADNGDFERAAAVDCESKTKIIAIAADPEISGLAVLLRALDDTVDIYFDAETQGQYYPYGLVPKAEYFMEAIREFISQEVWLGDIPQAGWAIDVFRIAQSAFGREWTDGDGNPVTAN